MVVLRSALKTISVTRHAWAKDIEVIQILDHAFAAFPNGVKVKTFERPITKNIKAAIAKRLEVKPSGVLDQDSMLLVRVLDKQGHAIGCVLRTQWKSLGQKAILWWNVSLDFEIIAVIPEGGWPSRETAKAFRAVRGLKLGRTEDCSGAAELAGLEVLTTVLVHENAAARPPK